MNFYKYHKKIILIFLFVFCGALFGAKISQAATYYVCNSGSPACSDSTSSGTEAKPWCTMNYAVSRATSGDTVYVKNGTYNENVLISGKSGGASYITFQNYAGHAPMLNGDGVDSGRNKIINSSYIKFIGFTITNYNQGLFIDNSNHLIVQDNTVHHVGQEGVHIFNNSSFITFQNNIIHDTRQWDYNGEGLYIGTSSSGPLDNTNNITAKKNTIYSTNDEGIELKPGTHDLTIDGNTLYNVMKDPAYSGDAGAIEINEATISCSGCAGGKQTWPSNPNHIIRNNVVYSSKTGIRAGTGCTVYNNIVYNTVSPYYGILADNNAGDSYTRKIYHNTIDIPSARAIVVSAGTADIRNNIGPSITNNLATNNAFYVNKTAANYHLTAGSAPINAGVDLTATVPVDIEGNNRLSGSAPDIGAYEYVSGDLTPPAAPSGLSVN